jgi:hypothetical protein
MREVPCNAMSCRAVLHYASHGKEESSCKKLDVVQEFLDLTREGAKVSLSV